MSSSIAVFNRQRATRIDGELLRRLGKRLLENELQCKAYEVNVFLVGKQRITELNEQFVKHQGPTDVITFDYTDKAIPGRLAGDIFVCVPVAVEQAPDFRTAWQEEVLRYIIHGVLHLSGMEDHSDAGYRRMKRAERRLLGRLVPGSGLHRLKRAR